MSLVVSPDKQTRPIQWFQQSRFDNFCSLPGDLSTASLWNDVHVCVCVCVCVRVEKVGGSQFHIAPR
jgi:hypothetical protein